jgi:hypothetical protein
MRREPRATAILDDFHEIAPLAGGEARVPNRRVRGDRLEPASGTIMAPSRCAWLSANTSRFAACSVFDFADDQFAQDSAHAF